MSVNATRASKGSLILGIDTGGTSTDAVIVDESARSVIAKVIAKVKVPTTHHELVDGVAAAIDAVLASAVFDSAVFDSAVFDSAVLDDAVQPGAESSIDPAAIGLVSLSTTLATNALVEGHGQLACLVAAGFGDTELERLRHRLAEATPASGDVDDLVVIAGGHDALGAELAPVDEAELATVAAATADRVTAYAVATQFSVRNPSHELAIARTLSESTGHPVTCSHELSSRLDGPRRALTAMLNAQLIGMIARLEAAVRAAMTKAGISAPLMIVRGDGSLVASEVIARRPIETILSGPAASIVGAQRLAGLTPRSSGRVLVVDIGGTTTDVAVIDDDGPTITPDGAIVAGHRTMVDAIDLTTHGIGGDSEIRTDTGDEDLRLGPARAIPLSRLAATVPTVTDALAGQLAHPSAAGQGRLLVSVAAAHETLDDLDEQERRLLAALDDGPRMETEAVGTNRARKAMDRLRRRDLIRVATFTPTDAAVILGRCNSVPVGRRAAEHGAELLARRRDTAGNPIAHSAEALAKRVERQLTAASAELLLADALRADGLASESSASADRRADTARTGRVGGGPPGGGETGRLLRAGLDHHRGFVAIDVGLAAPIVAVGASASTYYPGVAEQLGGEAIIPEHAEVANAVGAAAARVRIERQLTITRPRAGRFLVHGVAETDGGTRAHTSLEAARADALAVLTGEVAALAVAAGADPAGITITDDWETTEAIVAGRSLLVEATLTTIATGRPKIGLPSQ